MKLNERIKSMFGNSDFQFDKKTGTITKYLGNKKEVVIPEIINVLK